jgi:hypothetical protein
MIKSKNEFNSVEQGVTALHRRMSNLINVSVSETEVFRLCVKPEDADIMRAAYSLGMRREKYGIMLDYTTPRYLASIPMREYHPLLPKYLDSSFVTQKLQGTETAQMIDDCANRLIPVSERWTQVRHLVQLLMTVCNTWKQVRSVMPGIVPLMIAGGVDALAEDLREMTGSCRAPDLPPSCLQALRDANALIAKAALINKVERPQAVVSFHLAGSIPLPWTDDVVSLVNP